MWCAEIFLRHPLVHKSNALNHKEGKIQLECQTNQLLAKIKPRSRVCLKISKSLPFNSSKGFLRPMFSMINQPWYHSPRTWFWFLKSSILHSAWKFSPKTAKRPRPNWTQTSQDRKFSGPVKTKTMVWSLILPHFWNFKTTKDWSY